MLLPLTHKVALVRARHSVFSSNVEVCFARRSTTISRQQGWTSPDLSVPPEAIPTPNPTWGSCLKDGREFLHQE